MGSKLEGQSLKVKVEFGEQDIGISETDKQKTEKQRIREKA